jgi:hypothetical protein
MKASNLLLAFALATPLTVTACFFDSDDDDDDVVVPTACVTKCDDAHTDCKVSCTDDVCVAQCDTVRDDCRADCD